MRKSFNGRAPTITGPEMKRRPLFECDICNFKINKAATLRNHKRNYHGEESEDIKVESIPKRAKLDEHDTNQGNNPCDDS